MCLRDRDRERDRKREREREREKNGVEKESLREDCRKCDEISAWTRSRESKFGLDGATREGDWKRKRGRGKRGSRAFAQSKQKEKM